MQNFGQLVPQGQLATQQTQKIQTEPGFNPGSVRTPSLVIASVLLDTSTSMRDFDPQSQGAEGANHPVVDSYNNMRNELIKGRSSRHMVALGAFGFQRTIFPWSLIDESPRLTKNDYVLDGDSPIYDRVAECIDGTERKAAEALSGWNLRSKRAYLLMSDGARGGNSSGTSLEEVREKIQNTLQQRGNFIFGVGIGEEAQAAFIEMGIPPEFTRNIKDKIGLDMIFREFSTMTTSGGNPIAPLRRKGGPLTF